MLSCLIRHFEVSPVEIPELRTEAQRHLSLNSVRQTEISGSSGA